MTGWRWEGEKKKKTLLEEIYFNKENQVSKQAPDHKVYSEIHKSLITIAKKK